MNINDDHGTTVVRRDTQFKPKSSWRSWLIGRPLPTADAPHQTIGKLIGLAVFASDALSSSAYGTQEMLVVLAVLGSSAYQYVFPLSLAIVLLLTIVVISYEQTIHAYPNGGGAYIVSRDNLGDLSAKVAAAALMTDYVLTVAVSISSGVANLVSAIPSLLDYRVILAIILVFLIMILNLRGVRESGAAIAIPAYFFIVSTLLAIGVGLYKYMNGSLGTVVDPPLLETAHLTQGVLAFLILRAFSSGTSALTGVEAISNGVPAFKEPRSKNAGITLIIMATILAVMTLGIAFLTSQIQAVPSEQETVISQIVRTAYGNRGILYLLTVTSTTIILILAANTSFAGFPPVERSGCHGWFFASAAGLPRKPIGLFLRYCFAGNHCCRINIGFQRQCDPFDSLIRDWCVLVLYAFTNRHVNPMAEDWADYTGRVFEGTRFHVVI